MLFFTAHAQFQFLDDSAFGLNRGVALVHMPVCAVYTKHRRMCVHRDPTALMMHTVRSKEPAVARTRLFIDSR